MPNANKPRRTVYTLLLSVCLFLGILCACLLVALVLIGKHLSLQKQCENNVNLTNSVIEDEVISVTIKVNDVLNKEHDVYQSWRLPRDVRPLHYDLYLNPDLLTGVYTGSNNITFELKERRDHLIVNSFKLNVTNVKLYTSSGDDVKILEYHEDVVHQLQVVDLEETLAPGVYHMYMEYFGSLNDRIIGFYESFYKNNNGEKR